MSLPDNRPSYADIKLAEPPGNLWTYFTDGLTRNYARFEGRARRAEYWGYTLFWWLFVAGIGAFDVLLMISPIGLSFPMLSSLWQIGTLIPNIAIVVRRLHDVDVTGWLILIRIIDIVFVAVGQLVIFIFTLMDSRPDRNRHGESPKYGRRSTLAVFE